MPKSSELLWSSLLKEPLVHFLAAGVVLFVVYSALPRGAAEWDEVDTRRIMIGPSEIQTIKSRWANQWGREPTHDELTDLVNEYIREEALYRQAMAMGLDNDDTIVRRRMAQKMTFLIEGMVAEQQPSESTLRAWFEENQDRYRRPSTVSFRHIYFSSERRGDTTAEEAARLLLKELADAAVDAEVAQAAGDRFMLQEGYDEITQQELSHLFGGPFAEAVFSLESGSWRGPIGSSFGEHLVFLRDFQESQVAEFEQVADRVATDWMRAKVQAADGKALREILDQYQVDLDSNIADQIVADRIIGRTQKP